MESTNNVNYAALSDPTPLTLSSDSEGTTMILVVSLLVGLAVVLL